MGNASKRKRITPTLLSGLCALCLLAGCHGAQYKEEEREALEKRGGELMQAWLDENMRGAGVQTAEADIYMYPSGPRHLTDFVAGTLAEDGTVRDYLVNTGTGAVYLLHDDGLLTEACLDYALGKLGLDGVRDDCRVDGAQASIWLPDRGNSYSGTETAGTRTWMPGELVLALEDAAEEGGEGAQRALLESFVRSPGQRDLIGFTGSIRVPDETDLEKCGMAYWTAQREENGIVFESFYLSDAFESVSTYSGYASYERYRFRTVEDPDIRILMKDAYWVEKSEKDGIKAVEGRDCDFADLTFEKTENGYLVVFPDYEHIFDFAIYADEDSLFRRHEYHSHEDREAYLTPGSRISGDRYFEEDLRWKEAGEDGYVLADENGVRKLFFGGEELIPRD